MKDFTAKFFLKMRHVNHLCLLFARKSFTTKF
jgi:hypothetical protein